MTIETLQPSYTQVDQLLEWVVAPESETLNTVQSPAEALIFEPTLIELDSAEKVTDEIIGADLLLETTEMLEEIRARRELIPEAISAYIQRVRTYELLTPEKEFELFQQVERGREARILWAAANPKNRAKLRQNISDGTEAFNQVIMANTRLVIFIAKRYQGRGVSFLDLIEEGNIGLIRAAKRFDLLHGNRFSTYATWWIRLSVQEAVENQGRLVRLSRYALDALKDLNSLRLKLKQELQREPKIIDMAIAWDVEEKVIQRIIMSSRRPIQLDSPIDEEDTGGETIFEYVESNEVIDQRVVSTEAEAFNNILHTQLMKILQQLPPREALILKLLSGLWDGQAYTLEETGIKIGGPEGKPITKERVRQLRDQAIGRLDDKTLKMLREFL